VLALRLLNVLEEVVVFVLKSAVMVSPGYAGLWYWPTTGARARAD
jgi:hypothetical protein